MNVPYVSIIILNYKTPGLTKYCVKRFVEADYPFWVEIIVVDNDSRDGTPAMLRRTYPHVRCIAAQTNGGYAAGNNLGIKAARGAYIVIANPDIVNRPGALAAMVDFLDTHPTVGLVGPTLVSPNGTRQTTARRFPTPLVPVYRRTPLGRLPHGRRTLDAYARRDANHAVAQPVDWIFGACITVRRAALADVGLLDERYFMYFEDADWCRRFWIAGYEVWHVPQAVMTHYHRRQSADHDGIMGLTNAMTRIHITSAAKYFWKWRRQGYRDRPSRAGVPQQRTQPSF